LSAGKWRRSSSGFQPEMKVKEKSKMVEVANWQSEKVHFFEIIL
jgi:hypothetical protein